MGDLAGGMFAAQGILAALYQRERTGHGQRIDISLLDCQTSLLTYRAQYYFVGGEIAQPVRSGHVFSHPIRAFRTKTFDIVIDANTDGIFIEICKAIGATDLCEDPRFKSREDRLCLGQSGNFQQAAKLADRAAQQPPDYFEGGCPLFRQKGNLQAIDPGGTGYGDLQGSSKRVFYLPI